MSTRNRTSVLSPAKVPATTRKFELPALPLDNFGSLTDGTNIPPPERELTPPPAPESIPLPASSSTSHVGANGTTNGARKISQLSITGTDGTCPSTPDGEGMLSPVMSPTSPNRPPSSMKRFLSRKSMNADYNHSSQRTTSMSTTNVSDLPYSGPSRPESSLSFVSSGGTKTKKKRSWWQKLMGSKDEDEENGGANQTPLHKKRTSTVMEKDEPMESLPPRKRGPPPPKLPELRGVSREGKADGGFGGDDMFINIR